MKKYLVLFLSVLFLTGCGVSSSLTVNEIAQKFKDEGLELGGVSDLPSKEFGDTRIEGIRILINSLGEDSGGRLFKFKSEKDMENALNYYVELGKSGPLFYSHTHSNGVYLLQMNGDMEDSEFKKYVEVMDSSL